MTTYMLYYVDPDNPAGFFGKPLSTPIQPKIGDKKTIRRKRYEVESLTPFEPETKVKNVGKDDTVECIQVRFKLEPLPKIRAFRN
jgi:hypothetical protein